MPDAMTWSRPPKPMLWRYNPAAELEGKNPFTLDSKEPNWDAFEDFLKGEVRYALTPDQGFCDAICNRKDNDKF